MSASGFESAPLWYTTRSTGIVAFVLLTVVTVLGVAATQRVVAHPRWPRFATQDLHRNLSLLSMVLVLVHVITTLFDSFVDVSWLTTFVPYAPSSYRRFWVALGTIAFDGMLVAAASGFLRARTSITSWKWLHRSAYASWALAFVHFLKSGTDTTHGGWALWLDILCLVAVGAALAYRLSAGDQDRGPVASLQARTR